jgi:uncharacterized protein (TIGR00255 family)
MTGFGQASIRSEALLVKVEIRTVNHRFAEFSIRMPRELMSLEDSVRKCLSASIARGRADVYIAAETLSAEQGLVSADWALFEGLLQVEREALRRVRAPETAAERPAAWLMFPDVLRVERAPLDAGRVAPVLMEAVEGACAALVEMRAREGARLGADLRAKAAELSRIVEEMQARAPEIVTAYRDRLRKRIADFGVVVDDARLSAEVALFADRAAIDEELVRLYSHVEEFGRSLETGSPVGRRLDFIVQEMQRELNTIASKAQDLVVTKAVVDAKALVEQLREQVQNIE